MTEFRNIQPKYSAGEMVFLKYTIGDEEHISEVVYVVVNVRTVQGTTNNIYHIYTVEAPDGRQIAGFLESKLTKMREVTARAKDPITVKVGGLKISAPLTSDELLDNYSDYSSLYELTGLDEYREMRDEARKEWERLYGKPSPKEDSK